MTSETKCGFATIIGLTNAGKSTLVNRMVGAKVSIVSRKVQTTRRRVLGIQIQDQSQVILVDTPGIFSPEGTLEKSMVKAAWASVGQADVVIVLVDASRADAATAASLLKRLTHVDKPLYLVLNKVDLVKDRAALLALTALFHEQRTFDRTFMISALHGKADVQDLLKAIAQDLPAGPWLYPADQITDIPMRLLAAEMTREKIYDRLHQELPYSIAVETETWEPFQNGSVRIDQVIHVQKANQKIIVLGKQGQQIKKIGELARKDISAFLGCPVHLFLYVRVTERWKEDKSSFMQLGLESENLY